MLTLTLVCSIISLIISLFAISLALWSIIEHRAMKNSTHRIEWRPVQDPFENKEEDLEEFGQDPISDL